MITKKMQLEDLSPGYFFRFDFHFLHMLKFPHLCVVSTNKTNDSETRFINIKKFYFGFKEVDWPGAVSGEPWRHDCRRHSGVDEEEKGGALRQHCGHGRCIPGRFQHGQAFARVRKRIFISNFEPNLKTFFSDFVDTRHMTKCMLIMKTEWDCKKIKKQHIFHDF